MNKLPNIKLKIVGRGKSVSIFFYLCFLLFLIQGPAFANKTIKLLTVGNSFARNATKFLPDIVKEMPDCDLFLGFANIGGGPLNRHYNLAIKSESDSTIKPYNYRKPNTNEAYYKANLKEILTGETWDIITMQQFSMYSFKYERFVPYFDSLYAYIKKYAPQANIMIHQTWAYRADDKIFLSGEFSQSEMYRLLTENYMIFAKKYNCIVLPSGAAFQLSRKKQKPKFSFPDPKFDYKNPEKERLPMQEASLNIGWKWQKDMFSLDAHHANDRGCYLAACTWIEVLFNVDARKISFVPQSVNAKDAKFLRSISHKTISKFNQVARVE